MTVAQDKVRQALTWSCDRVGSPDPPATEAAYFDEVLEAWVLTRNADIQLAFRTSDLIPTSFGSKREIGAYDEGSHRAMRTAASDALFPAQLNLWREQLAPQVEAAIEMLPQGSPVDLMETYARPLCLSLAAMATGLSMEEARRLSPLAKEVSAASAEPCDAELKARAKARNTELRACFSSGPEALRDSGFVALSHTTPCLLGNAWIALLKDEEQWRLLHTQPALVDQAVEELLRYAGLARVLFRVASEDLSLNGTAIRRGSRLILRIVAGNRDTTSSIHANRLDITRRGSGHLTLGAGPHACVGANLIRMAIKHITLPLVMRFERATLLQPVDWQGGSGFQYPESLWVNLQQGLAGARRR